MPRAASYGRRMRCPAALSFADPFAQDQENFLCARYNLRALERYRSVPTPGGGDGFFGVVLAPADT